MQLASRFALRSPVLRSEPPLSDDQIRALWLLADGMRQLKG